MMRSKGPVQATFRYFDETLGTEVTFECELESLMVDVEWDEGKRMELEEILDRTLVCFGPDTLSKMILRETNIKKDITGRYGRIRSVRNA